MAYAAIAVQVGMQIYQGAQQAKAASRQSTAQNKMIAKYNEKTMYSALEQITQLNQQRAQQRQDTAAALYNVSIQGNSARDAITSQAAATDTIGASVSDAIATVNQKQGQATGSAQDQYMRAIDQSNNMLKSIVGTAQGALQEAVDDKSAGIMMQAGAGALGSGLGALAGAMAGGGNSSASDVSGNATSTGGSFDYQGYNPGGTGGNPFGLSYSFDTNTSLSGN